MRNDLINEIRIFNRYYTRLTGVLKKNYLDSEYSLTEVRILYEIKNNENISARGIMEILGIDEGYLSRTLSKLEKSGIIERVKNEADKRIFSLHLTPAGELEVQRLDEKSQMLTAKIVENISTDDLREMVGHMGRLQEILTQAGLG